MAKVCKNGLCTVGNIACNNADNQIALRDHIDVIVRALGQHIDNAEVGSSSVCVCLCVNAYCMTVQDIIVTTNNVYMLYG